MALAAAFGNVDVAANYMMDPDAMANIQQNAGQSEFNIPMNPLGAPMEGTGGGMGGMMPQGMGMPPGIEGLSEENLTQLLQQNPEMFAPLFEVRCGSCDIIGVAHCGCCAGA